MRLLLDSPLADLPVLKDQLHHEYRWITDHFYKNFQALKTILLGIIIFSLGCEAEVTYNTSDVVVDINKCVESLNLESDNGCGAYYGISSEGCFVLSDTDGSTHRVAVRLGEMGISPINGDSDLLGELSLSVDQVIEISVFLFSTTHESDPARCDSLRVDGVCEDDCVIAVKEHPLQVKQEASLLRVSASQCVWEPSTRELSEILCDQRDNDCDGQVDEDSDRPEAPREGDECSMGTGACLVNSTYQCLDGAGSSPRCALAPLDPLDRELCDNIDNDCDGEVDETFDIGQRCAVLEETVCFTEGVVRCEMMMSDENPESIETYCDLNGVDPLSKVINLERGRECDNLDNDCDYVIDEHFVPMPIDCGVGSCSEQALSTCAGGVLEDACRIGEPEGDDSNCNGVDDDCDGKVDEAYRAEMIQCGLGVCLSTGPILCINGETDNLCIRGRPIGDDSDCDRIDDDCDQGIDEGYEEETITCGTGACQRQGTRSCTDSGVVEQCTPGSPSPDLQCDGVDNDCDGRPDDEYLSRTTSCGLGFCEAQGITFCTFGVEEDSCSPKALLNVIDLCDGIDSDCDGEVDEDHVYEMTLCGVGACLRAGQLSCVSATLRDTCVPGTANNNDNDSVCDGVDSDCDGQIDEGFEGEQVDCGVGSCAATGYRTCINGSDNGTTCVMGEPAGDDPSCDGIDQDCDQRFDEDFELMTTSCGVGACLRSGESSCVSGVYSSGCIPGQPVGNDATCDGIDADCDGRVDEGYQTSVTACGEGICQANGQLTCVSGVVVDTCAVGEPQANDQQCDQQDNDCDGLVDEGYVSTETECGVGSCKNYGNLLCTPLGLVDSCSEQEPPAQDIDARCDGLDSDCDGAVDEGYVSRQISCGVGVCARNGETVCVDGEGIDDCEEGMPSGADNSCNLLDDDCDGSIDESYMVVEVTCQDNACTGEGEIICTNNGPVNTCTVESSNEVDDSCDGVDQDCDGEIDEHYQPPSNGVVISCGSGSCENTNGSLSCVDGSVVTVCTPNQPTGDDTDCDGVDDDCDEVVDESFSESSTCGVGECIRTTPDLCVNGQRINQCLPGAPAPFDLCGNESDDNCDGAITDYQLQEECEQVFAACTNSGVLQCNAGLSASECSAEIPQPRLEVCDGEDNDCNGQIDDNILFTQPNCENNDEGVFGICQRGTLKCENNVEVCEEGDEEVELSCSGQDEDCDSFIDEELVDQEQRRLLESCGNSTCKWRCGPNDNQLTCRRDNGNACN